MIHMHTTYGLIILELDAEKAPKTVANFLTYVREGFYDGTIFHRVIDNFMIQGGGFLPGMRQKPTYKPIENEAKNGLRNDRGTIAMARTGEPDSATSQFFINVVDNTFLNYTAATPAGWGYCVFAKIADGMQVVDQIKGMPTNTKLNHQNVPATDIVIQKIEVID